MVVENAIKRTVSSYKQSQESKSIYIEQQEESLINAIEKQNRIVLLGDAGSGKSTELANLADYYSRNESIFIPVFQRMNTYVDENIEDFLPIGWQNIPESSCLIILDGLDEIQPSNFNTAIRKITTFFARHEQIRCVISCRTNFYQLPTGEDSGCMLADFSIYFINDLKAVNIEGFARKNFSVEGKAFLNEVEQKGYGDLLARPFFLHLLLQKYKDNSNLNISKAQLFNDFIEKRFDFDQQHFNLTNQLKDKKYHVMKILQKVALTMEYMGTNHITFEELRKILPKVEDLELVRFSTAFKNDGANPMYWGFEHNNIQEFLAASVLQGMDIMEIKKTLSFDSKRIKPSWVNTLFFLMGIIDEERRNHLIDWILDIEPEILIKIEPDKIDSNTRFEIFKNIFRHYKSLDIWIGSNKFTKEELARFPNTKDANQFLLNELSDSSSSIQVRLNAMELIRYQKLNGKQQEITKEKLIAFIFENKDRAHIVNSAIRTLTKLGLVDLNVIETFMSLFENRKNQYIRSAMYKMIRIANSENQYIDYLIEGMQITEKGEDREELTLWDESNELSKALDAEFDLDAFKKLLRLFSLSERRIWYMFDSRHRLLEKTMTALSKYYIEDKKLYDIIFHLYIEYAERNDSKATNAIAGFFIKSGNKLRVFKDLLSNADLLAHQKAHLYLGLLDKELIDYLITEYNLRNLTNKELYEFYKGVEFYSNGIENDHIKYLDKQIKAHSNILNNENEIDYKKLRLDNDLMNFAFYFLPEEVRIEIITFFERNNIEQLDWSTLFSFKKYDFTEKTELKDASFDLLVAFLQQGRQLTLEKFLEYTEDLERLRDHLFYSLKEKINTNEAVEFTEEQKKKLEAWVLKKISVTDIKSAIKVNSSDRSSVRFDILTQTLWYYIEKFDIIVPEEKILDFTTFDDISNNSRNSLDFSIIEKQVGKAKVNERVVFNLKTGIEYDTAWINNAVYALNNQLYEAFAYIEGELSDISRQDSAKNEVLDLYNKTVNDPKKLLVLLEKVKEHQIRWKLIEILFDNDSSQEIIITLLSEIINNKQEGENQMFLAAQYLTKVGDAKGTNYYLDYLISKQNDIEYDYSFGIASLVEITDTIFLPKLMNLYEIGRIEEEKDEFNRLSSVVTEVLMNMGCISENNLLVVKDAILWFIEENRERFKDVRFMHSFIERMEFQFYLNGSQIKDVDIALVEVSKIMKQH